MKQNGYCFVDSKGSIISTQSGVFRTNCIDNLDRTNVVQGRFARVILQQQLEMMGILNSIQQISDFPFNFVYMNAWADNGDALSLQYSGTGALKSDITRTGKRTPQGVLTDGLNSMMRYYLNNFQDGYVQDALDLFVGNYTVEVDAPSPFLRSTWKTLFPYLVILMIGAFMLLSSVFAPGGDHLFSKLLAILFWICAFSVTVMLMLRYGKELVNKPSLVLNH